MSRYGQGVIEGRDDTSNGSVSGLYGILEELGARLDRYACNSCPDAVFVKSVILIGEERFGVRGFIIATEKSRAAAQFLILLDPASTRRELDLKRAQEAFHLSPRESQIVPLLIEGLTNKEIGGRTKLAESTVKDYVRKLMTKVGQTTRCGVVSRILTVASAGSISDSTVPASANPKRSAGVSPRSRRTP